MAIMPTGMGRVLLVLGGTVDLQLGGADDILTNMSALDSSVNRSLGSQINSQIKNLPSGTSVNTVRMVNP
jgi:hypothetical protein